MQEYEKYEREQEKSNILQKGWQDEMVEFERETHSTLTETQTVAENHLNSKISAINKVIEI